MTRLLFVTSTRLGDAVLSTGLLGALLDRHPGARVTVACGSMPQSLFAPLPGLDRVVLMDRRPRAGHWRALWRATVATRWDVLVDLRGSAFAWTVRAGRRIVWRGGGNRAGQHKVRQLAALIGAAEAPPAPRLWLDAADHAAAAAAIPPAGDGRPVLALAPIANWPGKCWPIDRYRALVQALTAPDGALPGARLALFAAPPERAAMQPLVDAFPDTLDLTGLGALSRVGAALTRCRLFIGNDSGLMHLAAAAGVPTLGLFGPSPPAIYGPWGPHCAVACTELAYPEHFRLLHAGSLPREALMDTLDLPAALAAATALAQRTAGVRTAAGPGAADLT